MSVGSVYVDRFLADHLPANAGGVLRSLLAAALGLGSAGIAFARKRALRSLA